MRVWGKGCGGSGFGGLGGSGLPSTTSSRGTPGPAAASAPQTALCVAGGAAAGAAEGVTTAMGGGRNSKGLIAKL